MKINSSLVLIIATLFCLSACKKNDFVSNDSHLKPVGFNYSTTREVNVKIRLLSNINQPLVGVPVTLNTPDGKIELLKSISNKEGYISTKLQIATYLKELLIKTPYVGLVSDVAVSISTNDLELTIGGPKGLSGNVVSNSLQKTLPLKKPTNNPTTQATNYEFMGSFTSNGTPTYLLPALGTVSAGLLSYINASLPNGQDVRVTHPEYLAASAINNLNVTQKGEVFITFVAEGAGYVNSLGYYTYPTGNPPATKDDIQTVKYIFPNASDGPSGGGLVAGSKVSLGIFNPGTTIAFVLLSDAWDGGPAQTVKSGNTKFYSDDHLNPESNPQLQVHSVLLNYAAEKAFVIGYEDLNRTNGGASDHDFNDLVLYASANPVTALSPTGVKPLDDPDDCDNDGVMDEYDEFPCDPERAYTTSYPSKYGWGTLAFEDNWPLKGDYDFNDLVLKFRYTIVSSASNKDVEMFMKYTGSAGIADYKNGFGVKLALNPSRIQRVEGGRYSQNYISFNANGTEAGQPDAVLVPFDNHKLLINGTTSGVDTLNMKVTFIPNTVTGFSSNFPFDPFLISNGRRGYEIHLATGGAFGSPTSLANTSLFGTGDVGSGYPYLDTNNMPWALLFPEDFKFPKEGVSITNAYLKFGDWTTSNGSSFMDWYNNLGSGYRNNALIHN